MVLFWKKYSVLAKRLSQSPASVIMLHFSAMKRTLRWSHCKTFFTFGNWWPLCRHIAFKWFLTILELFVIHENSFLRHSFIMAKISIPVFYSWTRNLIPALCSSKRCILNSDEKKNFQWITVIILMLLREKRAAIRLVAETPPSLNIQNIPLLLLAQSRILSSILLRYIRYIHKKDIFLLFRVKTKFIKKK